MAFDLLTRVLTSRAEPTNTADVIADLLQLDSSDHVLSGDQRLLDLSSWFSGPDGAQGFSGGALGIPAITETGAHSHDWMRDTILAELGWSKSGAQGAMATPGAPNQGPVFLNDDIGDTTGTATNMSVNTTVLSQIDAPVGGVFDRDVFRVSLVAGQTYTIDLERMSTASTLDTYLELRDSAGVLIKEDDDSGLWINSHITFTATTTGDYYVVARPLDNTSSGAYALTVNQLTTGNTSPTTFPDNGEGLPLFSWDQAAIQIGAGFQDVGVPVDPEIWPGDQASWGPRLGQPVVVTYAYRATAPTTMPGGTSGFSQFNAAQIAAAEAAFAAWAAVANITFVRVDDGTPGDGYGDNATILLANYSSGAAGAAAFAFLPLSADTSAGSVQGDVWVNISLSENSELDAGEYGAHAILHEIGHAIGLSHPGQYNAEEGVSITYAEHAEYYNDSRMFTVMSYFASVSTGGNLPAFGTVPQLHDIAAIQRLYGANLATRTGDTIYGFNSNTGLPEYAIALASEGALFSIWDGGGTDTLDLSGYTTNSTIDLRQEAFSSAGPGQVGNAAFNISIARGAVIENAIGGSGNDTIIGNSSNNTLNGGLGADGMTGGTGDDTYVVDHGSDAVNENSGEGTDTVQSVITYTLGANVENLTLAGLVAINGTGNGDANVITGNAQANTLNGGAGADTLNGMGGADTLNGGADNDTLNGGDGDDTINYTLGDGADTIDGGANTDTLAITGDGGATTLVAVWTGSAFTSVLGMSVAGIEQVSAAMAGGDDTLSYAGSSAAVTANLATNTATGFSSLSGVENLTGGGGGDTLTGDAQANQLRGGLGADTVNGGDGNDTIHYAFGDGVDVTNGGNDTDTLAITGADGGQTLSMVWNGSVFTSFNGGTLASIEQASADLGNGTDTLRYLGSSAGVTVNLALGTATGFTTIAGVENVVGTASADTLTGDGAANNLSGDDGADVLTGAGGADVLTGAGGDDQLDGGDANDVLNAGAGVDAISAGEGDDTIRYTFGDGIDTGTDGGNGTDTLQIFGTSAGQTLDVVWNGTSFTSYRGGAVTGVETVTADLDTGTDTLRYTGSTAAVTVNLAGSTATGFASILGVEYVHGGNANDSLTGNALANLIIGDGGDDTITAGNGNDTLTGGTGADTISAGDGNDAIRYTMGDGVDTTDAGDGIDKLIVIGTGGADTLNVVWNGTGFTSYTGGATTGLERASTDLGLGADTLDYTGSSVAVSVNLHTQAATGFTEIVNVDNATGAGFNDTLSGTTGANVLNGGGGDDVLVSFAGADTLIGGAGNDTMTGGNDADTYVFAAGSGADTVNSFDADAAGGQDSLDISAYGITALDFGARVTIVDQGAHTLVTIDGTETILLTGVNGDGTNVIDQSDFLLSA